MAELHVIPTAKTLKVGAHKRRSPAPQPKRRSFGLVQGVAVGCAGVASTLLILSLAHLSHGIVRITHCAEWEAFALALGVDAGLIAAEAAQLVAGATAARAIKRWCMAVIALTLTWSGLLNAVAFAASSEGGVWLYVSCAFGLLTPMLVFALTKISVGLMQTR